MFLTRHRISVSTTTSLGYTGYSDVIRGGVLHAIIYTKSTAAPLSSTATLDITDEITGTNLLTSLAVGSASFLKFPRGTGIVNSTNGTPTPTTGGGSYVERFPIAGSRIKLAIAATSAAGQEGIYDIFVEGA